MPRYLYLLRHAQSADKQIGQTDKERVLTSVGLAEARAVGNFFKEKSVFPDLIISSSALRAKSTSQVVAEILKYKEEEIMMIDDLYEAQVSTFFHLLSQLEDHINTILIVNHNPVISYFATQLTQQQHGFLPAEVLALKFEAESWRGLQKAKIEVAGRFQPIV